MESGKRPRKESLGIFWSFVGGKDSKYTKRWLIRYGYLNSLAVAVLFFIAELQFNGNFPLVTSSPCSAYWWSSVIQLAHAFVLWADITFSPSTPLFFGMMEIIIMSTFLFVVWRGAAENIICASMDSQARTDYVNCLNCNKAGVLSQRMCSGCDARVNIGDLSNKWLGYCYHAAQNGAAALGLLWFFVSVQFLARCIAIYLSFRHYYREAEAVDLHRKKKEREKAEEMNGGKLPGHGADAPRESHTAPSYGPPVAAYARGPNY
jgi:hypothetical protein